MHTQRWQPNWEKVSIFTALVPIAVGVVLTNATTSPASAQSAIVSGGVSSFGVTQSYSGAAVVFGSPISAPSGVYQSSPSVAPFVYGSPIPTPIPVNPATGLTPSRSGYSYPVEGYYSYPFRGYDSYPVGGYYSYPVGGYYPGRVRGNIDNSTLINPILINPRIRDSAVINPVILNTPFRTPTINRGRIILTHPY